MFDVKQSGADQISESRQAIALSNLKTLRGLHITLRDNGCDSAIYSPFNYGWNSNFLGRHDEGRCTVSLTVLKKLRHRYLPTSSGPWQ